MSSRIDRLQVIFEVAGDGKLKAALGEIGALGDSAAGKLDHTAAASDRMNAAAKRAGAILGGTIVAGLALVIKNTMEAERVDAQLEARLKSTAGAAGLSKQALDDLATATARKTTFDDESIKSTEAMLLTFTKIHADVFPKAIGAITDMSIAMGTDLEGAAIQVGKALNDPIQGISALQRVGVTFSEEQKKVIKALVDTGQEAEAQKLILTELETEFGGAAAAARDTFGGAMVALKNNLMDLTEGSGGSLDGAKDSVEALNKALSDPGTKASAAELVAALFKVAEWGVTAGRSFENFGHGIGIMLAEVVNQAQASYTIMKNLATFGLADGTIAGAIEQQKRGREQLKKELDDMVLKNHGMTRQGYNDSFKAQFDLGLSGKTQVLGAGTSGSFNFAADQVSRAGVHVPSPNPAKPTKSGASHNGSAKPRELPDFTDADTRALQELVKQAAQADDEFAKLAATMAGPLAEAEYQHQQNLAHIAELGKQAGRTSAEIGTRREQETARYKAEAVAIADRANPAKQLISDLEFELKLLGMTNAERETAIDLRRLDGQATAEQAAELKRLHEQTGLAASAAHDQIQAMDSLRDSARGFFEDVAHGANAWDAAKSALDNFADALISLAAKNLMESLFGQQGTTGGGSSGGWISSLLGGMFGSGSSGTATTSSNTGTSSGGWLSSLLGAFFGGAKAQGGLTDAGRLYEVAEQGRPELFRANGRSWLIPGSNGQVVPLGAGVPGNARMRGGDTYAITVNVPRNTSYQTAQQTGQAAYAGAARASRRNGG